MFYTFTYRFCPQSNDCNLDITIGLDFKYIYIQGRRLYSKRLTRSTLVEGDSNIWLWYIKIRIELFSRIHSYEASRQSFIIAKLPA